MGARSRFAVGTVAVVAMVVVSSAGACGVDKLAQAPTPPALRALNSNVLRGDYIGSAACTGCHQAIAERFERSPMHRMTRAIEGTDVRARFDGSSFRFAGDVATLREVDGQRYVELGSPKRERRVYRVTELIGGRYREDFVGVQVTAAGAHGRALRRPPLRLVMPVSWVVETEEWRYKGYSVQVPERRGLRAGPSWRRACIFCHNTVPYLSTVFDDLGGIDRPPYQGSVPSNLLPEDRRLRFEIRDPAGLSSVVADEMSFLGAGDDHAEDRGRDESITAALASAVRRTGERFDRRHLVELGIGCESCHGGSREHAEDPRRRPRFLPTSPLFSVRSSHGALTAAEEINHACARCHSVLFSQYAHTWEGGQRRDTPGGSSINSGEARDFLLGGCARALSCTSCHDPHAKDDPKRLAELATPAGNRVCVGCHTQLAETGALRAHAHHTPSGAGGSCVGCHMPLKNAGLGYALTRYHRISSPTDPVRVERDRPLECAICHADASVESLVGAMERWWGKRYDRTALRGLYGDDLSVSVLEATLRRGLPHERTVAIDRLGRTGDRRYGPMIADQLANELPLNRYFAREALARLMGERPSIDMSLPAEELRAAGESWLNRK